ncbi:MAG TPA: N-acetylmuramoyl-L-alanine amidase [Acidimicrobiia bacterium]|nr:N-acetylmuramoyl-L-alanine amidase [Acidimicrobiia bacterium]
MVAITRRQVIGGAAGLVLVTAGLVPPARALSINPRRSWAVNRPPKGPLASEDVRFLIVHHSASRNGHSGADAPGILRSFYDYHTSPEKGWNDIAYNFLIDADGGIWEGRSGSLDGPVAGDATGGNQGFSQLVCIIGDYNTAQPSPASLASLVSLLAWLADRYLISTTPGAQITFTSRGSNLHPEGTEVSTPTITGHRAMSRTTCPGANLNTYVVGDLMGDVEALRVGSVPTKTTPTTSPASTTVPSTTSTTSPASTTVPPTTSTTSPASTTVPSTTSTTSPASTTVPSTTSTTSPASATVPSTTSLPDTTTTPLAVEPGQDRLPTGTLATAGAIVLTAGGILVWRQRRMSGR